MKITNEVRKWLKENAYAAKGADIYFITEFPIGEVPDRLIIPIKKRSWRETQELQKD